MLAEVLLLLEHELDFRREQATLLEAVKMYRASIGIRVPRLIEPLCTNDITAMSAEAGVKVTEAFPRSPIRRARIADQLIEALVAVPFFSREHDAIFHADPHAGNLLYDETNRELVVLDWALAERLSLESRRQLVLLSVMMTLRNRDGVRQAIHDLALSADRRNHARLGVIEVCVNRFFEQLSPDASPGTLDAMRLLDRIALEGVHFPPPAVSVPQDRPDPGWRAVRCRRSRCPHRRGDRARVPHALRRQPGYLSRPARMEGFRRHRGLHLFRPVGQVVNLRPIVNLIVNRPGARPLKFLRRGGQPRL